MTTFSFKTLVLSPDAEWRLKNANPVVAAVTVATLERQLDSKLCRMQEMIIDVDRSVRTLGIPRRISQKWVNDALHGERRDHDDNP